MSRIYDELEKQLCDQLRGVRLVCELDLEGETYDKARTAMRQIVDDPSAFHRHPALTVYYFVAEGVHCYRGGRYWPQLSVSGIIPQWAGPDFLAALKKLGLPTFEDETEGGHVYLAKILLHGGIPRYCAPDVLRQLVKELHDGSADARDVITRWQQTPSRLITIDRPARRFLSYGGDEAMDLIDRLIEMVRRKAEGFRLDPVELGLPRYLVEVFQNLGQEEPFDLGSRPPRPRMLLDAYGAGGPELHLPRGDPKIWKYWLVRSVNGRSQRLEVSGHQDRQLSVDPPGPWHVELQGEMKTLPFEFRTSQRAPVLLLDPNRGTLLRDQKQICGEEVIAVGPKGLKYRRNDRDGDSIPETEELPALSGAWSRWVARRLDLRSVDAIWIGLDEMVLGIPVTSAAIPVVSFTPRARIVGTPLPQVKAGDGQDVYTVWPELEVPSSVSVPVWRYTAGVNGTRRQGRLSDLPRAASGRYRLDPLATDAAVANVELNVLGPLGSDLRVSFIVVERITVGIEPMRVLRPDEQAAVLLRIPESVQIDGERGGCQRRVDPPGNSLALRVVSGTANARITVTVPRLQWAIRRREVPTAFGCDLYELTTDDIGQQSALLLRTQRQCQVELRLESDGAILQVDGPHTTAPEGRWAFSISVFADTVHMSLKSRLHLVAAVDKELVQRVAVIHACHEVSSLRVETLVDGPTAIVRATWQENRPFQGRVLRLWSSSRPWAPPVEIPVPDDKTGEVDHLIEDGSLPAGPYLAELAIADAWSSPVRPRPGSPAVVAIDVGEHTDRSARIQTLNPTDPCQYLELLLLGEDPATTPPGDAVHLSLREILVTALHLIDQDPSKIGYLVPLLFGEPDHLAVELSNVADEGILDECQLLRLSILTSAKACKHRLCGCGYQERERLFQVASVFAVAMDTWPIDEITRDRWHRHVGWPQAKNDTQEQEAEASDTGKDTIFPPEPGGSVEHHWLQLDQQRIEEIRNVLVPSASALLTWEGFIQAVFEWLPNAKKPMCAEWDGAYHTFLRDFLRTELRERYITQLTPRDSNPGVRRFPAVLLAAACHLIGRSANYGRARDALLKAAEFAPALVRRSLLLAIVLSRIEGDTSS